MEEVWGVCDYAGAANGSSNYLAKQAWAVLGWGGFCGFVFQRKVLFCSRV